MTSAHTINPYTTKQLPYDTERDFTPITVLVSGALTLVGAPKAGFDSMDKFLAAARANPGKYQFGSTENTTRMVGELFRVKSGLKIENVAYKGAAPMMQELVGGHIPVGFTSPLTAMSHHRNGTLRMLAVTSEKRLTVLPEVPTMAEAGVPGVDRPAWFALFGPGNMPPELALRIQGDVAAVLAEPETLAKIRDLASEPGGERAGRLRAAHQGRAGRLARDGEGRRHRAGVIAHPERSAGRRCASRKSDRKVCASSSACARG